MDSCFCIFFSSLSLSLSFAVHFKSSSLKFIQINAARNTVVYIMYEQIIISRFPVVVDSRFMISYIRASSINLDHRVCVFAEKGQIPRAGRRLMTVERAHIYDV
jgi:hypothetical protein